MLAGIFVFGMISVCDNSAVLSSGTQQMGQIDQALTRAQQDSSAVRKLLNLLAEAHRVRQGFDFDRPETDPDDRLKDELRRLQDKILEVIEIESLGLEAVRLLLSPSVLRAHKVLLLRPLWLSGIDSSTIYKNFSVKERGVLTQVLIEVYNVSDQDPLIKGSVLNLIGTWRLSEGLPVVAQSFNEFDRFGLLHSNAASALRRFGLEAEPYVLRLRPVAFPEGKTGDPVRSFGWNSPEEAAVSLVVIGEQLAKSRQDYSALNIFKQVLQERPPYFASEDLSDLETLDVRARFRVRWSRALRAILEATSAEAFEYTVDDVVKIFKEGPFESSRRFDDIEFPSDGFGFDIDTLTVHFLGRYGGDVFPRIQSAVRSRWLENQGKDRQKLLELMSMLGTAGRPLAAFFIKQIRDKNLDDSSEYEVEKMLSKMGGVEVATYFASLAHKSSGINRSLHLNDYNERVRSLAALEDKTQTSEARRQALEYFGSQRDQSTQFMADLLAEIALDPNEALEAKVMATELLTKSRGRPFAKFFDRWAEQMTDSDDDLTMLQHLFDSQR